MRMLGGTSVPAGTYEASLRSPIGVGEPVTNNVADWVGFTNHHVASSDPQADFVVLVKQRGDQQGVLDSIVTQFGGRIGIGDLS